MLSMTDLPTQLREQSAELDPQLMVAAELPARVSNRRDYAALLCQLLAFYTPIENQLDDSQWMLDWGKVNLLVKDYRRVALLQNDLASLGGVALVPVLPLPTMANFGQLLGCLFALEFASPGGRMLSPGIRAAIGNVPTSFYDHEQRDHQRDVLRLDAALRSYEKGGGDREQVLLGACITAAAFRTYLGQSVWAARR